jgi:hypothetical protein
MYTCILDPNELWSGGGGRFSCITCLDHNNYIYQELFFLGGGVDFRSLDYLIYRVVDQEMFMQWAVVFYTSFRQF